MQTCKMKIFITFLLISRSTFPIADTTMLMGIMSNTLGSLTALEELITENKKYMDKFNEIHADVEEKVWRADRVVRWADDIREAGGEDIANLDDLNNVLAKIKMRSKNIKKQLLETDREFRQAEKDSIHHKNEKHIAINKMKKISTEGKLDYNVTTANVETAKNTLDIKYELAMISKKLSELNESMSKSRELEEDREKRKIANELDSLEQQSRFKSSIIGDASLETSSKRKGI